MRSSTISMVTRNKFRQTVAEVFKTLIPQEKWERSDYIVVNDDYHHCNMRKALAATGKDETSRRSEILLWNTHVLS